MKSVLITGGSGFIGLHLAKFLLKKNYRVHVLDNFSRGTKDYNFKKILLNKSFKLYEKDLISKKSINIKHQYDYIFHFAAIVGVSNVIDRPYKVLSDNILMLEKIINFAKKQKKLKRFFFSSSSEVYADTIRYKLAKIPTDENVILTIKNFKSKRSSYLISKIYGESMCFHSELPITIIRPHNIYGPRMGMSHVIPELIKKCHFLKNKGKLEVYSPSHIRTFCYIDDAVRMIFKIMSKKKCVGNIYNIGNQNNEISMYNLAKLILKILKKNNFIKKLNDSPGSPLKRKPNMNKLKRINSFVSKVGLEEGIKKTYAWYKKNYFDRKLNLS